MARGGDRMEYLILLLLSGLTSICAFRLDAHRVIYEGPTEVTEGDAFQITCVLQVQDPALWTINTSQPILEENLLGYTIIPGEEGPFRKEVTLSVAHMQLYQEGEYRCNRNSREYHYVNVIPFSEVQVKGDDDDNGDDDEDDDDDDDDEDDDDEGKSPYEYKLEVNHDFVFNCTTSGDSNSPVTWYKNGVRIIEREDSNVEISGRMLTIEDAEEDDAGEYMCIVEPHYVEKYIGEGRIFRLTSPAKVVDLPDIVHLVKGDTLNLQCKTGGYPQPKITWIVGNLLAANLTEEDKRITLHSLTRSSLTIIVRNVTVSDSGLFTCRAENHIDQETEIDEESVYVHVRENFIQVNEDYPGMGKVLVPGEQLELVCSTSECPHCTVVWFKDGEQLRNITDHLEILGNNSVIIEHATYNDSGIYTCKINRSVLDVELQATIVVQSKINLKKFDQSSVVVQGSPLELYCQAEGGPMPQIKWYRGDEELDEGDDERIKILDHEGLKNAKLVIEDADYSDRNHYTCEAYNQIDSVNTTTFIRIKDKLAALWPFLGICAEVAILCSIIFVYERRKSMNQCDEPETNLPTDNKHQRDQKAKGQDVRQRK